MKALSKSSVPSTNIHQLRKFYDNRENNIHALENLGVQTDSYGSLLIPIVLRELPGQLRCMLFCGRLLLERSANSAMSRTRNTRKKSLNNRKR